MCIRCWELKRLILIGHYWVTWLPKQFLSRQPDKEERPVK